jgi:hypothetical protein
MHHPETLILAPLMAADYLLTRLGARGNPRQRVLRSRSGAPAHPLWRRAIARSSRTLAHVAYIVAVGAAFVVACRNVDADDPLLATLVGFFAGLYGTLIGLNVAALAMQRVVADRSSDIGGTLTIGDATTIALSSALAATAVVPLGIVAMLAPTPTTLGAATGAIALLVVHRLWLAHARRANERIAVRADSSNPCAVTQATS